MSRGRAPARRGRRALGAFLGLLLLLPLALGLARAQDSNSAAEPPIPAYVGYINDRAGVLDDASKAKLESFLDQLQKKTGAQFAVLIVKNTTPITPTEYKTRVFDSWKIGEKGKDNGLLMLVALDEREVRFETGYGLEGVLPDGLQSRIFREQMVPHFRQGDTAGGITAGVLACAARIAKDQNVTLEWDGSELRYGDDDSAPPSRSRMVSVLFAVIFVLVLSILRLRFRGYYGGWGGWGGGFGGFGGGFGGGGGGSSFGGFGGGSSGGGGGGGRW